MSLTHHRYEHYIRRWLELSPEDQLQTEAGFLMAYTMMGPDGGNTLLEDWQVYQVNNPNPYTVWPKCRQVGFSWSEAMKKLARSYLVPQRTGRPYLGIFLSLNQDEAKEKIFYLTQAWDTLPNAIKNGPMRMVSESKDAVEFADGTRILSYPAKAVRGKAGADITFDEAAHIPKMKSVYEGTTAATIRARVDSGLGITMGSTPLSQADLFAEIVHSDKLFKVYHQHRLWVHWWDSYALCTNVPLARMAAEAENWEGNKERSQVEDRVMRFGAPRLKQEFDGQLLESFLQEYEAVFGANKNAFIPYSLIMEACDPEWDQVMVEIERGAAPSEQALNELIWLDIQKAMAMADPSVGFWAGYDVARKHDWASLVIATLRQGKVHICGRFLLRDIPFPWQERLLDRVLKDPRCYRLRIDATGQGGPIAEHLLEGWGDMRVEPVTFTQITKMMMGAQLKMLYERHGIVHTGDREITKQVGSIQREVSNNGGISLEGLGEGHHADLAWAIALAVEKIPMDWERVTPMAAASEETKAASVEVEKHAQERAEYREHLRERNEIHRHGRTRQRSPWDDR